AKGIAGGFPLAAVTGSATVMDTVHSGGLGSTFGGNPVACAAALGAITTMREQRLDAAAARIGQRLHTRLRALAERTDTILDVRGRCALVAIEFVRPGTTEPDPNMTSRVDTTCHQQGVVVLTCGTYDNDILLLTPLVINEDLLAEGMDVLEHAITSCSD